MDPQIDFCAPNFNRGEIIVSAAEWTQLRRKMEKANKLQHSKLYDTDWLVAGLDQICNLFPEGIRQAVLQTPGWERGDADAKSEGEWSEVLLDPKLEGFDVMSLLFVIACAIDTAKYLSGKPEPSRSFFNPVFGSPDLELHMGYSMQFGYDPDSPMLVPAPLTAEQWETHVHRGEQTTWVRSLITSQWVYAHRRLLSHALEMDRKLAKPGKFCGFAEADRDKFNVLVEQRDAAKDAALADVDFTEIFKCCVPKPDAAVRNKITHKHFMEEGSPIFTWLKEQHVPGHANRWRGECDVDKLPQNSDGDEDWRPKKRRVQ